VENEVPEGTRKKRKRKVGAMSSSKVLSPGGTSTTISVTVKEGMEGQAMKRFKQVPPVNGGG
jgi:hypothetical protein